MLLGGDPTDNLHTAPMLPHRFSISWKPPSFARLGLIFLPQIEHTARRATFTLPGALHQMILGQWYLTMLQRLTLTLPNNRLCMVAPLLVAGCHPPFSTLRCLIMPYHVVQLSNYICERYTRVELVSTPWQGVVIAVIPIPHVKDLLGVSLYRPHGDPTSPYLTSGECLVLFAFVAPEGIEPSSQE